MDADSAATLLHWSLLLDEDDCDSAAATEVSRKQIPVQRYGCSSRAIHPRVTACLNSVFVVALVLFVLIKFRIDPHWLCLVGTGIHDNVGEVDVESPTVCYTKRCNETGHYAYISMNSSAEPCRDFDEFACGGWRETFGLEMSSLFDWRFQDVRWILLDILEGPVKETDGAPLRLAKGFYNQCTDLVALEKVGKEPILKLLDDYGGWPSLEGPSWEPDHFSLSKSIGFVNRFLRFAPFISTSLGPDYSGKYSMILQIEGPQFLLDKEKYRQSSAERVKQILDLKSKYVNVSAQLSENQLNTYEEDAMNVTYLEERLINATESENATSKFYENVDALLTDIYNSTGNESSSQFDLQSFLDEIVCTSKVATDLVDNKTALPVKVEDIHYLRQLVQIIDSTSPRVLANYLHFIVASKLSEETLKYPEFSVLSDSDKATALNERITHCRKKAAKTFEMAMAVEYMTQYPGETRYHRDVELMAENIKSVFNETLAGASWLSETFRKFLVNKLQAMAIHVGYPQWILDETLLLDAYEGLSLGPTYFDTILNVTTWQTDRIMHECLFPDAWGDTCGTFSETEEENTEASSSRIPALPDELGVFVVNAWHDYVENAIVLPIGLIGSPFYVEDEQKLVNYARIGFVIAHEIAHGVDDRGIGWTTNGTYNTEHLTDWDDVEVKQKQRCLAGQYSDLRSALGTDSLRESNGVENTADNVAMIMAYRAYRKWMESENGGKPEPALPHFEHWTSDQLFFLNCAMTWCETEEEAANTDYHSPGKLRATVPLQNSIEFAQAYNCELGTRMNPKRKCMDL